MIPEIWSLHEKAPNYRHMARFSVLFLPYSGGPSLLRLPGSLTVFGGGQEALPLGRDT